MAKLVSGRVKRVSQTGITSDRYEYLGLEQAEPNLGDPKVGPSSTGANPIPVGQVFQPVSVDQNPGERFWTPLVGFGTTVGVISVYENGLLPGGNNLFQKIHGLNFVGTGVTVDVPPLDGPFEGVGIATIRFAINQLLNQGEVGQIIYNTPTGYAFGAQDFYYDDINLNVGIGSTQPKVKLDVSGNVRVSGASTFGGIVELDNALRDINGQTGTTNTVLISTGTGVSWINQSTLSVAYANSSGVATNIGAGSTGAIPYQSASGVTTFLPASALDGFILEYDTATNKPQWVSAEELDVQTAKYAFNAGISTYAEVAGIATYAQVAGIATYAVNAGISTYAEVAGIATFAELAGIGITVYANVAGIATYAETAGIATYAVSSGIATYATNAGIATYAQTAGISTYAATAGIATYAVNAGIATNIKGGAAGSLPYQSASGVTTFLPASAQDGFILEYDTATNAPQWISPSNLTIQNANFATIAGYATNAGIATYAVNAGIATFATTAGYSTNAGIATNIKGGFAGAVVYQTGVNSTGFVTTLNATNKFLQFNGTIPVWVDLSTTGITSLSVTPDTINATRYLTFGDVTSGVTTVRTNTTLTFNPSTSSLGVGTATPRANLDVVGTVRVSGISTFVGIVELDNALRDINGQTGTTNTVLISTGTGVSWTNFSNLNIGNANFATIAGYATNAGIATYAQTAGIATFATIAGYATNAGIATNIKGGNLGELVYQSAANTTAFISTTSATNKFLQFNGTIPVWADLSTAGITSISVTPDTTNATRYLTFGDVTSGVTTIRANSTLAFNPSTSSLGVGTSSISARLHVVPQSTGIAGLFSGSTTNSLVRITQTGAGNALFIDETQPTVITGIGSVGIGTTNPSHLLDVNGTIRLRGALRDFNNLVGSAGSVLVSTGSGVNWAAPSSVGGGGGGGTGVDLYEEGTLVGSATSISFVSQNLTVSAASSIGIVTLTDNPTFGTVFLDNRITKSGFGNIIFADSSSAPSTTGLANILLGNQIATGLTSGNYNFLAGVCAGGGGNISNTIAIGNWAGRFSTYSASVLLGQYSGCNGGGAHNIFVGRYAGKGTGVGNTDNIIIGRGSGCSISGSKSNIFFGAYSGCSNTSGSNNIFIGESAGKANAEISDNIFIGQCSGLKNNTGINNIFIGKGSGLENTIGCNNIAIGSSTGYGATTGNFNNFFGSFSGFLNSGNFNNFFGRCSGYNNTGNNNNFFGDGAGFNNTSGINNTFIGDCAGFNNTNGDNNVTIGARSGNSLNSGSSNTIIGFRAGFNLTNGNNNTIIGRESGCNISTGVRNTFLGFCVGIALTSGTTNIAIGDETFTSATTGINNVVLGSRAANALTSGENNIIIGVSAGQNVSTGSSNIIIGDGAGTNTGRNNITISPVGQGSTLTSLAGISSVIVIGNTGITSFFTKMAVKTAGTHNVYWTSSTNELSATLVASSQRFKTNIRPYTNGLNELVKLESVKYNLIENSIGDEVGFIAEQVDEIGLDEFVAYDNEQKPLSLSYDRMIALAVNAIKDLKNEINELKERINTLENQ